MVSPRRPVVSNCGWTSESHGKCKKMIVGWALHVLVGPVPRLRDLCPGRLGHRQSKGQLSALGGPEAIQF